MKRKLGEAPEVDLYPLVALPAGHDDPRGRIQDLLPVAGDVQVQVIISCRGALRGNHVHQRGNHFSYLARGKMNYYWREPDGSLQTLEIEPGQMFFTPPKIEHAMRFWEDSVLVVVGSGRGGQDEYEADTTRVNLV